MLRRELGLLLGWGLLVASPAWGQLEEADPRATVIAPFLDADAFFVVRLDLRNLDIKTAADRLGNLAPAEAKEQVGQVKTMLNVATLVRTQLMEGGANEIYFVSSATGGDKPAAFLAIPVEQSKDPQKVKETIGALPGVNEEQIFVHKGAVIVGDPAAKAHVTGLKSAPPAAIAQAFKGTGNTDLQLIFAMNPKLKDLAKKNAPPGAEIPADAEEIANDIKAVALTANLPPKPAVALFVHTKSDAAAAQLVGEIQKALNEEDVKQVLMMPGLAKLAPFLVPKQDGPRFRFIFTEQNGGVEALAEAIKAGAELLGPVLMQGGPPGGFPGGPPGGGFGPPPGRGTPGGADPFNK